MTDGMIELCGESKERLHGSTHTKTKTDKLREREEQRETDTRTESVNYLACVLPSAFFTIHASS